MKPILLTLLAALASASLNAQTSCTCTSLGPELVVNGDFSLGNTGFQTTYTFATSAWPDNYGIANSSINPNPGSWMNCGDHTGGGNYMWADASSNNFNMPIWEETINVQPNTNYVFSFWMSNVNGDSITCPPGKVQFSINGTTLGSSLTAPNPSCLWIQNCVVWNSGSATTAVISILNQNAFFNGNDFGFDDFSFRECSTCSVTPQVSPTASICLNASTQLSASGGTSYTWQPSAGLNNTTIANPVASPVANTTYTVTVSNGSCSSTATVSVNVNQINAQVVTPAPVCKNTGAQLSASGGTSYLWKPATGLSNPAISNPVATVSAAATYTVIVSNGQCADSATVSVNISPDPVAIVSPNVAACSNTTSQLTAGGGTSYLWQPATGLSSTTAPVVFATPPATTTYTVVVFAGSCSDTAQVTVTVLPTPTVAAQNAKLCRGQSAQLQASGGITYSWQPSLNLSSPYIANPVVTPSVTTVYTVTASNGQCSSTTFINVTVIQPPKAIILTQANSDDGSAPMTVDFYNASIGATSSLFTMLDPSYNTYTGNFSYTYGEPGSYHVLLNVSNSDGCKDSTAVTIEVKPTSALYIPNAFTPNADGRNELFKVVSHGITEFEGYIFDRWGNLVYKWNDVEGGWDGTYKGDEVQQDVFVWQVKARGIDGKTYNPKGIVNVIR
jgi:gliding motility-associated-like protein